MTFERQRVLSVAVTSTGMAIVFLIDGQLKDWKFSKASCQSVPEARSFLRMAILKLEPDLVLVENPFGKTRKKGKSRKALLGLAQELKDNGINHKLVDRKKTHSDKYQQAGALAEKHPLIKAWLPEKPPFWESAPSEVTYFEALAIAEEGGK